MSYLSIKLISAFGAVILASLKVNTVFVSRRERSSAWCGFDWRLFFFLPPLALTSCAWYLRVIKRPQLHSPFPTPARTLLLVGLVPLAHRCSSALLPPGFGHRCCSGSCSGSCSWGMGGSSSGIGS